MNVILVFWGITYGEIGGPSSAAEATIAFTLGSFMQPAIMFLSVPVRIVAAMFLTLLSCGLLVSIKHRSALEDIEETQVEVSFDSTSSVVFHALSPDYNRAEFGSSKKTIDGTFVRLLVSSFLLGVCTAVMQIFFESNDTAVHDTMYTIAMPVASTLAGLLLICILLFSRRLDLAFSYQPVLLLVIVGVFLSLFLGKTSILACSMVLCAYQCMGLINWVLCADYCFTTSASSVRIFGFGRGTLSGGVLMGLVIMSFFNDAVTMNFAFQTAVGFCIVFIAAIACTFVFTPRHLARVIKRSWISNNSSSKRGNQQEYVSFGTSFPQRRELTLDEKVDFIAHEYEISGRAFEVLQLLVHGRSGTRIEQELYMSKGTVKTHVRRIYQKLDVHGKQELLDLIESVEPSEMTLSSEAAALPSAK